jgi:hypothetical protein
MSIWDADVSLRRSVPDGGGILLADDVEAMVTVVAVEEARDS